MPLNRTSRIIDPGHLALVSELVREWRYPRTGKTAEPVIHEADPGTNEPIHLYVVWSKWQNVPPTSRSEVILDAFETVRGREQVTRVAVAIGFTPEEGKVFGLAEPKAQDVGSGPPAPRKPRPRGPKPRTG